MKRRNAPDEPLPEETLDELYRHYLTWVRDSDEAVRGATASLPGAPPEPTVPLSRESFERRLLEMEPGRRRTYIERIRAGFGHAVDTWASEIAERAIAAALDGKDGRSR